MVIGYLKRVFGEENVAEDKTHSVALPIFLKVYSFETLTLFGQRYVFVSTNGRCNLKTYKAQKPKIEESFECPAVLLLEKSTTEQRNNLIENRISFVESEKQLFMPSLGVILNDRKNSRESVKVEKFTPQTQLCALFFLYFPSAKYTVKQIAEKINLNDMAISRALAVLENAFAVSHDAIGRTNYYFVPVDKRTYAKKIEKLFISPIWKRFIINKKYLPKNRYKSAYSAINEYSMVSDDEMPTYAISKEEYRKIQDKCEIAFEDLLYGADFINLEVWKYNPSLFAKDGVVDKFSLYLSFDKASVDERTEEAIEKLKESVLNGGI